MPVNCLLLLKSNLKTKQSQLQGVSKHSSTSAKCEIAACSIRAMLVASALVSTYAGLSMVLQKLHAPCEGRHSMCVPHALLIVFFSLEKRCIYVMKML